MIDTDSDIEDWKMKLLVVDDNEQSRYMLQVLLGSHGYQVETAANGQEALEKARSAAPDMVIADILMPVMDGFTLCRKWKSDDQLKDIPFVFYTATYTDPRDEDFALSLGAERFIVKPVESDIFVEMLQDVIAEHRAGRLTAPSEPAEEETVHLQAYNEVLIRKLEDKMLQLEEANLELARRRDRLELLHRIDRAISTTLALDDLLDQLTGELTVALDVNRSSIWLLDKSGESLHGRGFEHGYSHGVPVSEPGGEAIHLAREEPLVARLFETREPVMVPDVNDPAWADLINPEYTAAFHIRAFLAVPLIFREEPIGFLVLDDTRAPHVFQPEEIQLVQSVAVQAAIAIDNARLFEALRVSEERYRGIFDGVRDAIFVESPAGEILDVNASACEMFGWTREEFRTKTVADLVPPGELALLPDVLLERTLPDRPVETVNIRANGEPFPVEITGKLQTIGDESVMLVVLRDITERKRAEERIRLQMKRMTALHGIDMAITASVDLQVTLTILLGEVKAQLGVDAADILLLNEPGQTLDYAAGVGFYTDALQHTRLRVGEGHAGRAALERRRVEIPNLAEDTGDLTRALRMAGESFTVYYGVPLVAKGRVLGVMELFHRAPLHPDPEWLDFLDALAVQGALAIDNATLFNSLQRTNLNLKLAYDTTLEGWARALELRDQETEGHARRVTDLTLRLARAMGIRDEELAHVRRGTLLHDIGKMGIPDSILLKPGELGEEEWDVMRQHPVHAFNLLAPIQFLRPALDIPYYHHERWDGRGYPTQLKGTQIPLPARIFAVVDVWDALRSDRPYRKAWTDERAREHIRQQAGKQFDPDVVDMFFKLLDMAE